MSNTEKTGIVMEGGGLRAIFTVGILDVLMENDIYVDGAVGVSAGACFGCNYKSKQIGRGLRYNLAFCDDKRYSGLESFLKSGDAFNADFCYNQIPNKFDPFDYKAFKENPMEFYMVCTDVLTGKAVYKKSDEMNPSSLEWMRGSATIPLAGRIVRVDGRKLLDGGVSDSIPLKFMINRGYKKNIVIKTQPDGYVKKKNRFTPLVRYVYKQYPALVRAVANRHKMYNETLDYIEDMEKEGRCLVLAPDAELGIGNMEKDPENVLRGYLHGREVAIRNLDAIKKYLGIPLIS
ncbi:MAG: patatin family protein [Eubacterium sp.]|nr:patatin family protein [Eubacterium sp.]